MDGDERRLVAERALYLWLAGSGDEQNRGGHSSNGSWASTIRAGADTHASVERGLKATIATRGKLSDINYSAELDNRICERRNWNHHAAGTSACGHAR